MPPTEEQLRLAYARALTEYGEQPRVSGVDVGYRYRDGQRTDERVVRVHLRGSLEEPAFALAAQMGSHHRSVLNVPLDFVPGVYRPHAGGRPEGPLPVAPPRRRVVNPLRPGVSLSHARIRGGTLGLIVFDVETGRACALGNAHVLAGAWDARPGDPIVQPARDAGGRAPRNTIGELVRVLDDADGDAAIALLNASREWRRAQWDTGVVIDTAREARVGDTVEKSGARTGTTTGIVDGIGRYYLPATSSSPARGMDGFKIVSATTGTPTELSGEGDSGAVWYDPRDKAGLGLHVAGELGADPRQEHAIACHLPRVLHRLDVTLTRPGVSPLAGREPLFDAHHVAGQGTPAHAADEDLPDGEPWPDADQQPTSDDPRALLAESLTLVARLVNRLLDEQGSARRAGRNGLH